MQSNYGVQGTRLVRGPQVTGSMIQEARIQDRVGYKHLRDGHSHSPCFLARYVIHSCTDTNTTVLQPQQMAKPVGLSSSWTMDLQTHKPRYASFRGKACLKTLHCSNKKLTNPVTKVISLQFKSEKGSTLQWLPYSIQDQTPPHINPFLTGLYFLFP